MVRALHGGVERAGGPQDQEVKRGCGERWGRSAEERWGRMAINPERIAAAQARIAEEPHDVDSWLLLIKHCQCRLDCKDLVELLKLGGS